MKKFLPKILLLVLIISVVILFKYFDLGQFLTLDYIKQNQQQFADYYAKNKVLTLSIYFVV